MTLKHELTLSKETLGLLSEPAAAQVGGALAARPASRWICGSLQNCQDTKYPVCQLA